MLKFTTKRNASGNRYVVIIDIVNKTFKRDYNPGWSYSDYITIGKRDREKLIGQLLDHGFVEV